MKIFIITWGVFALDSVSFCQKYSEFCPQMKALG